MFKHSSFNDDVIELLKNKGLSREEFEEQLRKDIAYYFWSKSEHEIVITSFPPYVSKEELERLNSEDVKYRTYVNLEVDKKVDIYEQLRLNWDAFLGYVWNFRK